MLINHNGSSHRARIIIFPTGICVACSSTSYNSNLTVVCFRLPLFLTSPGGPLHRMREACWTCRSRTIRCDQTSIPCAKCEKAGLECFEQRPLRWVKGIAIRGKMRGRILGEDLKTSSENPPPQLERKQVIHSRAKSLITNITPSFALQDPCIHDLDRSSRFYLDYCGFISSLISAWVR